MNFMEVAIISVIGAGLLGFLGILVQYLFSQNARRAQEHNRAMEAVAAQGQRSEELHREAMAAIGAQGQRNEELHREAMDAITAQGTRMQELHARAMDAITALDREHREHREKLHTETMTQIAALSERTAVLETKI